MGMHWELHQQVQCLIGPEEREDGDKLYKKYFWPHQITMDHNWNYRLQVAVDTLIKTYAHGEIGGNRSCLNKMKPHTMTYFQKMDIFVKNMKTVRSKAKG